MKRRHRRLESDPELNITPFMNLMIVLVPVLLLGMVFNQIRTLELDFPGKSQGEPPVTAESLKLRVTLLPDGLALADNQQGLRSVLPMTDNAHQFGKLRDLLKAYKREVPDKTDIVLEVAPEVDYQTLVSTMDSIRSYPAVVAASVVPAELFPDVSLADAPEGATLSSLREER